MSQQSPFNIQSNRGRPLYRKKRVFALAAVLFVVPFLWLRIASHTRPTEHMIDELDGLLYMVAHTEHILPHSLDTSAPIAPSVWFLGEPANSILWARRVAKLKQTPIIVFSKTYCPYSRRAKDLLARYELNPAAHVVEVDLRGLSTPTLARALFSPNKTDDGDVIKRLLIRLTKHATFPNVILSGRSLGGYDNLLDLHQTGILEHELERAGVRVMGNVHGKDM